jgi:hypothetical protein
MGGYNIKMDLKEVGWVVVRWIHLVIDISSGGSF